MAFPWGRHSPWHFHPRLCSSSWEHSLLSIDGSAKSAWEPCERRGGGRKGCSKHLGAAVTAGVAVEAGGAKGAQPLPKVKVFAVDGGQAAHVGVAGGGLLLWSGWPGAARCHEPGRAAAYRASAQSLRAQASRPAPGLRCKMLCPRDGVSHLLLHCEYTRPDRSICLMEDSCQPPFQNPLCRHHCPGAELGSKAMD